MPSPWERERDEKEKVGIKHLGIIPPTPGHYLSSLLFIDCPLLFLFLPSETSAWCLSDLLILYCMVLDLLYFPFITFYATFWIIFSMYSISWLSVFNLLFDMLIEFRFFNSVTTLLFLEFLFNSSQNLNFLFPYFLLIYLFYSFLHLTKHLYFSYLKSF